MAEPDPHQLMTCPYNPAHQVEHYRMHVHLQKSHNQGNSNKKVTCPFDATHVVADYELDYHVTVCSKRHLFDSQVFVVDDGCRRPQPPPPPPQVPCEENWDDENVTSYKPDLSKRDTHIIRKPKGLTKSERRKFRMEGIQTFRPKEDE